jgi:L-lactate dehydrogenase complex protein LldG
VVAEAGQYACRAGKQRVVSRELVLGRIRAALERKSAGAEQALREDSYRRMGMRSRAEVHELFEKRISDYGGRVFRCSEHQISEQIVTILVEGGRRTIAVPPGIDKSRLDARISWIVDEGLSFAQIEAAQGVLTTATAAVAESGTIVLQHGPEEGRRALTLLPDYHLCILFEGQIVETLPECFDRLRATATRPTTFISGPSATADIEMTRIEGVHGPRSLDVIVAAQ